VQLHRFRILDQRHHKFVGSVARGFACRSRDKEVCGHGVPQVHRTRAAGQPAPRNGRVPVDILGTRAALESLLRPVKALDTLEI
jgi:hypothetical protein